MCQKFKKLGYKKAKAIKFGMISTIVYKVRYNSVQLNINYYHRLRAKLRGNDKCLTFFWCLIFNQNKYKFCQAFKQTRS